MSERIESIMPMEPGVFGVLVTEGTVRTPHRVAVDEEILREVGIDPEDIEAEQTAVRETIDFLLEREPATSIPDEFSLDDIAREYPEFRDELRTRLASL